MTSRKDFLIATSAMAALAPSAALAAAPAPAAKAADASTEPPTFVFDRATFDAIVTKDVKHRHSFASRDIEDGFVFGTIEGVLDAYEQSLDGSPTSVASVAILYHGYSVLMGFNDKVWNELIIPGIKKMPQKPAFKDILAMKVGDGNPYLHKSDDVYDSSIESLAKRGAYVMICNNATTGIAQGLANALKLTHAQAYAQMAGGVVPNGLLVPAGVWAIHAVQEAHFTYQQVNL